MIVWGVRKHGEQFYAFYTDFYDAKFEATTKSHEYKAHYEYEKLDIYVSGEQIDGTS